MLNSPLGGRRGIGFGLSRSWRRAAGYTLDYSLYFDGTDDIITVPHDTSLNITDGITVSAWIKPYTFGEYSVGYGRVISKRSTNTAFDLAITGADDKYYISIAGTSLNSDANTIELYKWHHIAVTYDKSNLILYYNGAEHKSTPLTAAILTNTSDIEIGNLTGFGRHFDGLIGDVYLFGRALGASEISSLYNFREVSTNELRGYWKLNDGSGCTANDESVYSNDGTLGPNCAGGIAPVWSVGVSSTWSINVPASPNVYSLAGYYVWAPQVVRVGDTYYLIYSRWADTEENVFNDDWGTTSEIAIATSSSPFGPFTHNSVILSPAATGWDSQSVHAGKVLLDGDNWRLYYSGNQSGETTNHRIGVATASSITGPYTRGTSNPIIEVGGVGEWDNYITANPSPILVGSTYYIYYKGLVSGGVQKIGLATASSWDGSYTKYASNPVFELANSIEDAFILYENEQYQLLVHDIDKKYADITLAASDNGLSFSNFRGLVDDGYYSATRLEFPFIYVENGEKKYFYASKLDSSDNTSIVYGTIN